MAYYNKGANAERELIHVFFEHGFSVVRVAGSGKTALPAPDIVALKDGKILCFECKAWDKNYLNISSQQMDEVVGWSDRAGAILHIAWKLSHKGWIFFQPNQMKKTGKGYSMSKENALKHGLNLNVITGEQSQIKPV